MLGAPVAGWWSNINIAALSRFSKIPPTRLDNRGIRGAGIALCQMASAAGKRACE